MVDKKDFVYSYDSGKPKKMDFDRATALLSHVKKHLDKAGIRHFLFFGTLLGAHRENNFIHWDHDMDIAIFWEDAREIIKIKQALTEDGHQFCSGTKLGDRYSDCYINKKGFSEKVDIYSLIPFRDHRVWCRKYIRPDDRHYVLAPFPDKYFVDMKTISFKGMDFLVPSPIEEFLEYQWGTWWKAGGGQIGKMKNMHIPTDEFDREVGL